MAVERKFLVKLLADSSQVVKSFNDVRVKAEESFGATGVKLQGLVPLFQKIQVASTVAFAGLTAAAGVAIKAAVDAQSEQNRLRQILLTTGGATQEQVGALIQQAEALEKVGVASAGNIITAQSQLATFDLQFETIQRLTPAITDYVIAEKGATASAEDFKSMTNALAQALQGNFGALTKSGFVLDETTKSMIKNGSEAERSAALVDVLNSTYEGFNATARETVEGRLVALRNSFDAVRTSIGEALLPMFEKLIGLLQGFADWVQKNTAFVVGIGVAVGVFTGLIVALSVAMKVYATAAAVATAANTAFGVSLSATGIGAIVVLIGLLVAGFVQLMIHSEKARNVMKFFINLMVSGLEMVVNAVIGVINSFIQWNNMFLKVFRAFGIGINDVGYLSEVNFGRLGGAADGAGSSVQAVNQHLKELQGRVAGFINSDFGGQTVNVAQATERLVLAQRRVVTLRNQAKVLGVDPQTLADALKEEAEATRLLTDLQGKQEKTVTRAGSATKKAVEPMKEYTKVLKDAQKESDAFGRAQRNVTSSQESVADAADRLRLAEEALQRAQQAGSPAEIADAQRALAAAERGLTRSKFGQEEAVFAVVEAERRLAEIRGDAKSSAIDIRRAEIALQEAKFRVVDAEDSQVSSTRTLEEARRKLRITTEGLREGDAELVPLQKAVTDAQKAQSEATDRLTEAIKAQSEALADYREALRSLDKVAKQFPGVAGRVGREGLIEPMGAVPPPVLSYPSYPNFSQPQNVVNIYSTIADESLPEKLVGALRTYNRTVGPLEVQVV